MKNVICELILIFLTNFWCDFYGCNLDSRQMVLESSFTINQIIIKDYDLCPGQLSSIKSCQKQTMTQIYTFFLTLLDTFFQEVVLSYKGVLLLPWFPTVATSMVVLEPLVEASDFLRTLAFLWCAELAVDKLGLGYGFRCLFVAMASRISSIRDLNA